MPDVLWNASHWGQDYTWPAAGEEWSYAWGGSDPQWYGCLYPRLQRHLPARRIVEIAPGFGRWSRFLIPSCDEYLGIDLNQNCIDACARRFASMNNAQFAVNDGKSLSIVAQDSCDLIFSFDSLVHAENDILAAYVPQMISKLSRRGVAFLHHSNVAGCQLSPNQLKHSRGETVSAESMRSLIEKAGGSVIVQEIIDWVDTGLIDCLTTFGRTETYGTELPILLTNSRFMQEASIIKNNHAPYYRL